MGQGDDLDLDLDLLIVEERLKMIDAWLPWIFSHYSSFFNCCLLFYKLKGKKKEKRKEGSCLVDIFALLMSS